MHKIISNHHLFLVFSAKQDSSESYVAVKASEACRMGNSKVYSRRYTEVGVSIQRE